MLSIQFYRNTCNDLLKDNVFLLWQIFLLTSFLAGQPFERNITQYATVLLALSGAIRLPALIKQKCFNRNDIQLFLALTSVFIVASLSWVSSDYFDKSFGPLEIDIRFILMPLVFCAFYHSTFRIEHFIFALLISSCAYAYVAWSWPQGRVAGDENAVTFGNGAFLLSAIAIAILVITKNRWLWVLLIISSIGFAYASFKSGTRGSFLAVPLLTILFFINLNIKSKIVLVSLIVLASAVAIDSVYFKKINKGINEAEKFIHHNNPSGSIGQRLEQWRVAYCFFLEDPILGKGAHQFGDAIKDPSRTCEVRVLNPKGFYVQAHSYYFNTLATQGLVGTLAAIFLFSTLLNRAYKSTRPEQLLMFTAIISMLSYGLTVDLFFHRYLVDKHLVLLMILSVFCTKPKGSTPENFNLRHKQFSQQRHY